MKRFVIAALLASLAAPAFADTDDLDRGVRDAVTAFRSGSDADALVTRAQLCYSGVDTHGGRDKSAGDQLDYCFAFEMTSARLLNKAGRVPHDSPKYFSNQEIATRAAYNLERARVLSLPEEFNPYIITRAKYVGGKIKDLS
ncbi:hypothetical protein LA345_39005 (plasmid) [Burkholderia vietnamiensis]|uniref:Uncharacterized protein n=1 Tax=Burkholderia vietnamiensis (strain G4 / LMG 22486) TaxID=269482 RepID=A4JWG1_BURVG|nr:hypothetical protein Bcep1808_7744 [Burkholderia vietnamiensis G4]MCB4349789.1 hypothetical protein [Burkholderia vietnamiensis]